MSVATGTLAGAVFLDRDGTIIRDTNYIGDPGSVQLLPRAAAAIRTLNEAGWRVIVITNQSGIARNYFTTRDYERVRARLDELLRREGARIDATFMCPHHPDITGPCECRKPGTLLYRQAAEQFGIDLEASWYIGDRAKDVEPAAALGGTGILVRSDQTTNTDYAVASRDFRVVDSLADAVRLVIESAR